MVFALPESIKDKPKEVPDSQSMYAPSAEMVLHDALSSVQKKVAVCTCGVMTSRLTSSLAAKATSILEQGPQADDVVAGIRQSVGRQSVERRAEIPADAARRPVASSLATSSPGAGSSSLATSAPDAGSRVLPEPEASRQRARRGRDPHMAGTAGGDLAGLLDGDEDRRQQHDVHSVHLDDEDDRLVDLEDGEGPDMAMGSEDEDNDAASAVCAPVPHLDPDRPAAFLLSSARREDDVAAFLPSEDVVNMVFSDARVFTSAEQARLLPVRQQMEEDMMMSDWLYQRLQTPSFSVWLERDNVNVQDVLRAIDKVKRRMHLKVAALMRAGVEV